MERVAFSFGVTLCLASASFSTGAMKPPVAKPAHIFVIAFVDIEPDKVKQALPVLRSYVSQASMDHAHVVRVDLLQQIDAPNHFTLVEVLRSKEDYRLFVVQPFVKAMRFRLDPMLGSPFDERLNVDGSTP
jgi:quinol monooxygenase YgiN